jgi:O-antigen/teichoic acid export membrane protein
VLANTRWAWNPGLLRGLLAFGLPTVPAVLFVMVINLGDRFILEFFFDKTVVGVYSAGYKIGMIMALVVTAFRFAWHPFFLSISDQDDAPQTFARILTLFTALAGFIFLLVGLVAPPVLTHEFGGHAIIPVQYADGLRILPYVLLAHIFQGVYVNLVVGMYIKKRTLLAPLFTGTGMVVNLVTNFVLIGHFGWDFTAAGVAALLAYASQSLLLYFVSRRFYPVPYEFSRLARIALVVGALYLIPVYLELNLLWTGLLAALLYFPALGLSGVISPAGVVEGFRGLLKRDGASR